MKTQESIPKVHVYRPDITFEDTNLVGNVYFANYVRWQNECRNQWLKVTNPEMYASVFRGANRICVTELALDFHDPAGVTVGDAVEIEMDIEQLRSHDYRAATTIGRLSDSGSSNGASSLVKGHQRFEIVAGDEDIALGNSELDERSSPAYQMSFPVPLDVCRSNGRLQVLDMIRWQGNCRERFLSDHAPSTLRFVAAGSLALHTSRVSFQLLRDSQMTPADCLRLEMRLTHLKGGRLTVQFDYYVSNGVDGSITRQRIATGEQSLCCKRPSDRGLAPAVFPADMLRALRRFTDSAKWRSNIDEALDFVRDDIESDHPIRSHENRQARSSSTDEAIRMFAQTEE